jgi:predicted DNA-binding transcriptional regulator
MALSLKDIKTKAPPKEASKSILPPKKAVMPWQDRSGATKAIDDETVETDRLDNAKTTHDKGDIEKNGKQTVNRTVNKLHPTSVKITENKRETNGKQTVNKLQLNSAIQTDRNWATNGEQSDNNFSVISHPLTGNKTGSKAIRNTQVLFKNLTGHQRDIVLYIFRLVEQSECGITPPIAYRELAREIQTNKDIVKTSCARLLKKGFLNKEEFKDGVGGWVTFSLPPKVLVEIRECVLPKR